MKIPIRELLDLSDDFKLCDGVFCRIADVHGNQLDIAKESKIERVVTLVWHSSGIISNGGFQYLFEGNFNGDPGFVYTVAAYKTIKADLAAEAFIKALCLFPKNSPPDDIDERLRIYKNVSESERNKIDREFWSYNDEFPIKLAAFIRANRSHLMHLP